MGEGRAGVCRRGCAAEILAPRQARRQDRGGVVLARMAGQEWGIMGLSSALWRDGLGRMADGGPSRVDRPELAI